MTDLQLGITSEGHAVSLTDEARTRHMLVLGKSGTGKSNLLLSLMAQDMQAGKGFCLLDAHGALVEDVLTRIPAEREQDVVLIDIADTDYPIGLNLFWTDDRSEPGKTRLGDDVCAAFQKVWDSSWGILIETWLKIITHTFVDNGRGTMVDIPRLLTDKEFRDPFVANVKTPYVKTYWASKETTKGELAKTETDSTVRRIGLFLMNSTLTNIVSQERVTLDFDRIIAENKICLIKLPITDKRVGRETVRLVGTILLQRLLAAALQRRIGARPYFIYADEFQHLVTRDIVTFITDTRKYGVGIALSTQGLTNVEDLDIRSGITKVGSIVALQVGPDDAATIARELREPIVRPVREITRDALSHFLSHVQPEPWLTAIQDRVIRPIEQIGQYDPNWRSFSRRTVDRINDYLVHLMTGFVPIGSDDEIDVLSRLATSLWYYTARKSPVVVIRPESDLITEGVAALVHSGGRAEAVADALVKSHEEEFWKDFSPEPLPFLSRLFGTIANIRRVGHYLAAHPIYEGTEDDPTRHDLAGDLTRLESLFGRGTAVCKLLTGEYRIQTPLAPAPSADAAMRERIIGRSRAEYAISQLPSAEDLEREAQKRAREERRRAREEEQQRIEQLFRRYGSGKTQAPRPLPPAAEEMNVEADEQARLDALFARFGTRPPAQSPKPVRPVPPPTSPAVPSPPMVRREPRKKT